MLVYIKSGEGGLIQPDCEYELIVLVYLITSFLSNFGIDMYIFASIILLTMIPIGIVYIIALIISSSYHHYKYHNHIKSYL